MQQGQEKIALMVNDVSSPPHTDFPGRTGTSSAAGNRAPLNSPLLINLREPHEMVQHGGTVNIREIDVSDEPRPETLIILHRPP